MLALALTAGPAAAQEAGATVASGTAHLQAGRFAEAAEVFRAVTALEPENGVAWYRLGMALQDGGDPDAAIAPLERAAELGFQTPYAWVRVARANAAMGRLDDAWAALEASVETGLNAPSLLEHDDLAPLAGEERFAEIRSAVATAADPCTHMEPYHQLDFWVGEWAVYDPSGAQVGENRIERLLGSCALQENWTDAAGRGGKSLNVYDRSTGLWRQLWVSDTGNVMDYSAGRLKDGAMHFEGTALGSAGDTVYRRMIFTPVAPDTVTQEIFQSPDGKTWSSTWKGIYVRRAGAGAGGGR